MTPAPTAVRIAASAPGPRAPVPVVSPSVNRINHGPPKSGLQVRVLPGTPILPEFVQARRLPALHCQRLFAGLFRPISKLMVAGAAAKLRFASGRPGPAGDANLPRVRPGERLLVLRCQRLFAGLFRPISELMGAESALPGTPIFPEFVQARRLLVLRCQRLFAGLFRPISELMGAESAAKLRFASGRPGPAGDANLPRVRPGETTSCTPLPTFVRRAIPAHQA